MSITLDEALAQLNIERGDDDEEVELYVAAANEWVETRVSDTSPSPVKLATLLLVDHLWATKRGPVGSPVDEDTGTPYTFGFAIPNRVLELLAPYMTAGIGAKPAAATFSFPDAVAHPDPVEWSAP